MSAVLTRSNHLYPSSDGKPVAETEWHFDALALLREILRRHFADDPEMYVSGNMLIYYEAGNKRKHVSPDVFAVRGVHKEARANYLIWEEGKSLDLVVELTSKSTRNEDLKTKMALYRDVLAVREYFLFDPHREYLKPPEQGYRLVDGEYVPIEPVDGRFPSEVLGLHLFRDHTWFRPYDPETKLVIPTPGEAEGLAAERAEYETARAARAAERAQREAERANHETARAFREAERANQQAERADQEAAARATLEEEVRRLRALLEQTNQKP